MIKTNVMSRAQANRLHEIALRSKYTLANVSKEGEGAKEEHAETEFRNVHTPIKDVSDAVCRYLDQKVAEIVQEEMRLAVGTEYPWEYAVYRTGCFYKPHSDVYDKVDGKLIAAYPDRLVTAILLLSPPDAYTGGALVFPQIPDAPTLEPGDLLLFLSADLNSYHAVEPVLSGARVTLINWYSGIPHGKALDTA